MTTTTPHAFSIVVGLDFRQAGGHAFGQAAHLARAVPGSELHLVHVFETELDRAARERLIGQLRMYANEKAASIGGIPGVRAAIHLRVGDPVHEIVQLASDVRANLIVIGAHKGPNMKSWLLGSVAHRLLSDARCPVLVAGPEPVPAPRVPTVEPPCAACEQVRQGSRGAKWWCDLHAHHAVHAHVFSYQRELPLTTHDSEVIPTGIEF